MDHIKQLSSSKKVFTLIAFVGVSFAGVLFAFPHTRLALIYDNHVPLEEFTQFSICHLYAPDEPDPCNTCPGEHYGDRCYFNDDQDYRD